MVNSTGVNASSADAENQASDLIIKEVEQALQARLCKSQCQGQGSNWEGMES